jgi:hypothetical protein
MNEADTGDLRGGRESGSESRFKRSGILYVELPSLDRVLQILRLSHNRPKMLPDALLDGG